MKCFALGLTVLCVTGMGTIAAAQTAPTEDLRISGEIGVVSDYRYRGLSASGGQPAIYAGLTAEFAAGYYVTVWASEIEEYGFGSDGDGATVEIDAAMGRTFTLGGWDWDVAIYHYGFPDGDDVSFLEMPVSASRTLGDFTATLGLEYAPSQPNLGNSDNIYVYVGGDLAPTNWPVSVNVQVGHEDGYFADGKLDWRLRLAKSIGPLSVSVMYVDSDAPGADSEIVGGLSVGF